MRNADQIELLQKPVPWPGGFIEAELGQIQRDAQDF